MLPAADRTRNPLALIGFRRTTTAMGVAPAVTVTVILAAVAGTGMAIPVHAQWGSNIDGTYQVMSDGEWAQRDAAPGGGSVFIDQKTVTERWTVHTTCASPIECSGTVTSSLGWTGTARLDDHWFVDHEIPNWLPCPDGTFAPGHQKFILWAVDPATNERQYDNMSFLAGRNITKAPSGACGRNQPLVIEMPVKMVKLS
jgi:hypothetical protein